MNTKQHEFSLSTVNATRRACLAPLLLVLALAFPLQAQFTYITNNGAITITKYVGPGGDVTIPSETNGLPVTSIGAFAFSNCFVLANVTIPNCITNIGASAFYRCTNLTGVTIPSGLTTIESSVFRSCYSLANATIPNSVTSIKDSAFAGCRSLTSATIPTNVTRVETLAFSSCYTLASVTIPNSVTNIVGDAFYNCPSLTAIMVDPLNSFYSSLDGVLFDKSQTLLIQYPGARAESYTTPSSVTTIANGAFAYSTHLTNLIIGDSVTNIGDWAFSYGSPVSVTIPNSVTSIGSYEFYDCTNLASVTIPNSVTSLGYEAFYKCPSLTSFTIGNNVTNLGAGAFHFCSSLTNVTIGENVTAIGDWAFGACLRLASVTIPTSVTNVGYGAFAQCHDLISVTIGSGVANLEDYAFYECPSLTGAYFQGNAPSYNTSTMFPVFSGDNKVIVYYLPGTTNWASTLAGRPTALWNPQIQTTAPDFGLRTNQFGFTVTGTTNIPILIEATANLSNAAWLPLQTLNLTNGSCYFTDSGWTNSTTRFYRLRSP